MGDSLLLRGTCGALEYRLDDPNVLVVDPLEQVRRRPVIAVSAAAELHVSPKPLLVAVAVAAAAAFLTPVATPANLMVMEPGGYRFGDYWKLGLPLLALYGLVAVVLVPVIWRF